MSTVHLALAAILIQPFLFKLEQLWEGRGSTYVWIMAVVYGVLLIGNAIMAARSIRRNHQDRKAFRELEQSFRRRSRLSMVQPRLPQHRRQLRRLGQRGY